MKSHVSKLLACHLAAAFVGFHSGAVGQTAEEKGLEIAQEVDRRDTGFSDSRAVLEMLLTNRQGQSSSRKMSLRTLEVEGEGDKTLIVFDQPRDVKGTAFLSYTHKVGPDDQWLYLPALKRVKRISSNNKSGPFVGSEFAYEDLSSQEVEKYTYKYLGEETLEGIDCFVIERYPVDPKSGYTRQVVWIDASRYLSLKIDFFDRKDALLKSLVFEDYVQYLDQYWRADRMEMVNHQTGKATTLLWADYSFRNGYEDRDFDQRSLRNVR